MRCPCCNWFIPSDMLEDAEEGFVMCPFCETEVEVKDNG